MQRTSLFSIAPSPVIKTKLFFNHYLILAIVLITALLRSTQCKETILIDKLMTKNDKILMKLVEQINSHVEYDRTLIKENFKCKSIIKNELTKNYQQPIQQLKVNIDFIQVIQLGSNKPIEALAANEREEMLRIDRVLDMLNGQCLTYSSATFIYEYCHKEHVRQFDSQITKQSNSKAEYQDICMGLFHPQKHNAKKLKPGVIELSEEEKKTTLPKRANFSSDYHFLAVQDIDHQYGYLELEESSDGNLLFTNSHLTKSDAYILERPIFMQLHCLYEDSGEVFINYAMVVNPYILIYTNKKRKCEEFIKHRMIPTKTDYFKDNSTHPIRAYGRFIYGNVEEFCTSNWGWQRKNGGTDFDNHLEEGSLLYFQFFNENSQSLEYSYTTVKRIITGELIQLEHPLGKSFSIISQYEDLDYSTVWTTRFISKVTKCNLLFKKHLKFNKPLELSYVGNSILRVKSQIKEGEKIGCLCKSIKKNGERVIDLDIVIKDHLWLDYYQAFISTNTNLYLPQYFIEDLLTRCQNYRCFQVLQPPFSEPPPQPSNKFTQIIKLSNKNAQYSFPQTIDSSYYILNIKNSGIIKLITQSNAGINYTYLLTEGQIIKIAEFQNGTKEIIKENKYYENVTGPQNSLYHNYIYIKINKLPNGTTFGGIWKYSDNVYFPRFQLFSERLISLQRSKGYAYLKIFNLQRMNHSGSLAIVKGMKSIEEHYMMHKKMMAHESNLFLGKSYSINYTYISGKYCDPPVNKFRKTTAILRCGKSWFGIRQILETSPCEYEIEIQTILLCKEGYKDVTESDDHVLNRSHEDQVSNSGVMCHPQGIFDQAFPYIFMSPLSSNT